MISTDCTTNKARQRKIYGIIGAVLTLLIPFFLMLDNHNHELDSAQSFCPFKMLTGFPCPGCGITKSLVYFYEGDWVKSFGFHLFGPFVIVFCLIAIVVLLAELKTGKTYFNAILFHKKTAYGLAIFLGIYHLIRLVFFIRSNSWDDILHQSIWR
ncbi:MAG TPA: DUF2752 domain-containing protein [Flavobacterium sp.]|nr:DUF2752 domain-containing protein [Flavobacterium sp.]